jgi:hypothetical protein
MAWKKGSRDNMTTLGEEYPKEQQRLRQLLEEYASLGNVGRFGHMMISDVLRRADAAAISGDTVAMIGIFKEMQECK